MGIYIYLNISDTITENEWEKAYQKSVRMVNQLPLMEAVEKEYYGQQLVCAVKTVERSWFGKVGWHTIGDSITLKTAEDYFLPKELPGLVGSNVSGKPYVDPYMSVLPVEGSFDFQDERCGRVISLWGDKTQAEPYHFYLLAVACMLEQELPGKVAVYGNITKGQCRSAARIASDLLGETVGLPDRCDPQKLYERVRKMPLQEYETVEAFAALYMGNQDKEFGSFICGHFTGDEWKAFWSRQFRISKIGTYGFVDLLKKYLLWGFPLVELKDYVQMEDGDGNDLSEKFVRAVLDTEIFLEDKDCEDVLEIDHEDEGSYSVYTLLAQAVFAGVRNRRVDRYVPMDKLKAELIECVGDRCDVARILTEYIEERKKGEAGSNPTDLKNILMRSRYEEKGEAKREYDITRPEDLKYYEKGDTIDVPLNEVLVGSFQFYRKMLDNDYYKELVQKTPTDAIRFLISQNRCLLLMEESWKKIFREIETNMEALERYYPMVRVKPTGYAQLYMVQAFVLNDELYQYCMEQL